MNAPPEILQFMGSLVAIFALAGLAWWMKLGGRPRLANEADARIAAGEVEDGYETVEVALDRDGRGAVMQDHGGRILVLKPHGNKFAGRVLTHRARAKVWTDRGESSLEIDCAEWRFGKVYLQIDDPTAWADRVNALGSRRDA